ncbi:hypothetical protein [Nocardia terpenica]|uniref:phage tail protein n=1 Tax=Nocardia terpenica TaxID=455432 RepID=UPI0003055BBA|nr:hypothetical protein [Nocardia terpenica]NQE88129.1 hypothetical protein [Nocardia terpenica]
MRTTQSVLRGTDAMGNGFRRYRRDVDAVRDSIQDTYRDVGRMRAAFEAHRQVLGRNVQSLRDFGDRARNSIRGLPDMARRGAQSMRDFGSAINEQARYFRERDRDLSNFRSRMMAIRQALRETAGEATGINRVADAIRRMSNRGGGDTSFLERVRNSLRGLRQDSEAASSDADKADKDINRKVGFAGRKFLGLSRVGWIVTAVFLAAAPAISIVGALLAGLPSLLSAAAIGFAALYLGFDGIKKAASVLSGDLANLKSAVSGVFQERMTPMFESLKALMPMVTEGMKGVANGLSDMFQGVFSAITSEQGMGQIKTMLAGTAGFFSSLQGPMEKITSGFLTFASAGAQSFTHLTGSIDLFATKFNEMATRVTSTPAFDQAMQGLSQVVDGILEVFGRLMESGINSMGQLGQPILTFLHGIADLAVALMPPLTSLAAAFGNVFGQLGSSLAPIIQELTPAFSQFMGILSSALVPALQVLGQVLTPIATQLNTILVQAFTALQPVIPPLVDAFGQVATILGGVLLQVLQAITPFIAPLATAFAQILQALLPLVPVFVQLAVTAIQPLIDKLPELMPSLVKLAQALADLITAVTPLIVLVAQVAAKFAEFGATLLAGVLGAVAAVVEAFSGLVTSTAEKIGQVIEIGRTLGPQFLSALGDMGSLLVESGKALISGFITGIKSMLGSVADAAKSIVSAARDFFPFSPAKEGPFSGSGWVLYSGQSIGEAFADGMTDQQKSVVNAAKSIMQAAKEVFGDTSQMGIVIMVGQFKDAVGEIASSAQDAKATVSENLSETTTKTSKKLKQDTKSSINKVDDATKQRMDDLELQAAELDDAAQLLEYDAKNAKSKTMKDQFTRRAQALREQADALKTEAKKLEYQAKYGKPYESILDEASSVGADMEDKGLTIMQRLQKGMKNGLPGVLDAVKRMANDMGEVFGVDSVTDAWDKSMKDAKLDTLPQDAAKETGGQFLSDIGFGSGSGFLPQLLQQGATQYNYYISDFEAAKQDERNQQARKALTFSH